MCSANQWAWNYRHGAQIDGGSILHTPSILGIFRVLSILVLRALAVRVVPPDENLPVLAVPAVQNSEIFEVGRASTLTNPAILRARKYPQYRTSKYCPYLQYPLDINPKLLPVHEVPAVFFLQNTLSGTGSTLPGTGSICALLLY